MSMWGTAGTMHREGGAACICLSVSKRAVSSSSDPGGKGSSHHASPQASYPYRSAMGRGHQISCCLCSVFWLLTPFLLSPGCYKTCSPRQQSYMNVWPPTVSTGPRCPISSPSEASPVTTRWISWTRNMRSLIWMAPGLLSMAAAASRAE